MSLQKPCACDESATVMVQVRGVYDGGLFFECRGCGRAWHRWEAGSSLWQRAVPYVDAANHSASGTVAQVAGAVAVRHQVSAGSERP
jgi:hypothetical protein